MARVNCYLPDELKEAIEAIEPPVSFSGLLRMAAIECRNRHQAAASVAEPEPEPVG